MLSEIISQTEKGILRDLSYICNLRKANSEKQKVNWWLPEAEVGKRFQGYKGGEGGEGGPRV